MKKPFTYLFILIIIFILAVAFYNSNKTPPVSEPTPYISNSTDENIERNLKLMKQPCYDTDDIVVPCDK